MSLFIHYNLRNLFYLILKKKIEEVIGRHNTCALATAAGDFVRCTPIEYHYVEGCFYLFSEGGLKFRALKGNPHVCLAIFAPYSGFGQLEGLRVTGTAQMAEPWSEEYRKLLDLCGISEEAMKKLAEPMHLIRVRPAVMELLCSELKQEGYSPRQRLCL
ncbi:pyridoxamine 5'-phosphate oxidase family protein [Anaerotignum lactatifermentans]|uniref:Pyridoxamine 5'-phosphate oxidase family protein n=1 Tax=Anaerotignum lactatifermentans TaxID=160404 RepID=A0ABS2GE28_9FIRM|nr:pyridoxamine 5'-phosphate oxidase family protein [Anaerotignum lactatifermentans]MBM6830434.1 pyridoxamine 5'-phosphate oxidase family protein [Anaerotignum lactatifermentans]MBM6878965.1 pyridoxamine 5'-phosphate oxidase family protein [Anaerotignum lactatifermentans]MBM6951999.1 pyridoxamine 5'-phosphate oxidase family protein [Anaerotignum lactatifermentans]